MTNAGTWLDPAHVAAALGITVAVGGDWLAQTCAAVGASWAEMRGDLVVVADPDTAPDVGTFTPTANVEQAATLNAVNVYRRRDTYQGTGTELSGLGELGYVPTIDPLVERLGGIGRWRRGAGVLG